MAMSVGPKADSAPMVEMNTTPLIDVMLVLLIMFIITLPIQTHASKLDMPQQQDNPQPPPTPPVVNLIEVDFEGNIFWNRLQVNPLTLEYRFSKVAEDPNQEVHIRPDKFARYEIVNKVLAAAQRAEVTKIGFVGNEQYL
jgi:biopolymer transport protein ExbD